MKVKLKDATSPRSDGQPGGPTDITVGKEYQVAEVLTNTGQYSIINDQYKIARYSQYRFEVTCDKPVRSLRDQFNILTHEMRMRLKDLESKLKEEENV